MCLNSSNYICVIFRKIAGTNMSLVIVQTIFLGTIKITKVGLTSPILITLFFYENHIIWWRLSSNSLSFLTVEPLCMFLIFWSIQPHCSYVVKTPPPTQHNGWVWHENDCANHPTTPPPTETFQPLLDQLESWNLAQIFTRPI